MPVVIVLLSQNGVKIKRLMNMKYSCTALCENRTSNSRPIKSCKTIASVIAFTQRMHMTSDGRGTQCPRISFSTC